MIRLAEPQKYFSNSLAIGKLQATHRRDAGSSVKFTLHCHSFYELYYFIAGGVSYMAEGVTYRLRPHTLLLMEPSVLHGIRFVDDSPYERYVVQFDGDILPESVRPMLLTPFLYNENHGNICYDAAGARSAVISCLDSLLRCAAMPEGEREAAAGITLQPLLLEAVRLRESGGAAPQAERPLPHAVSQALAYINNHMCEPLCLDDVSAACFISSHRLEQLFRIWLSASVMQYICRKRVTAAQEFIRAGSSAQEAARLCGFSDYSIFYRACRKVSGLSPSAFAAGARTE